METLLKIAWWDRDAEAITRHLEAITSADLDARWRVAQRWNSGGEGA